ncbi:sulfur carrier protein ThiS [Clostridium sp. UBA1056]|uniref:sulfur carrier protein ThiS n=1 Tax=unclassified Clostridium TaxID=2614128 RepID=UPI0032175F88
MKVNGKNMDMDEITTISSLLNKLGINEEKVVVELNKEIVIREEYSKINLQEDDTIEVISFVGGG